MHDSPVHGAPIAKESGAVKRFRKLPVVVEATQFHPDRTWPEGVEYGLVHGVGECFHIMTLEGAHIVSPGDWVITGVKGEKYPCKPEIFELTYEPEAAPTTRSAAPVRVTLREYASLVLDTKVGCDASECIWGPRSAPVADDEHDRLTDCVCERRSPWSTLNRLSRVALHMTGEVCGFRGDKPLGPYDNTSVIDREKVTEILLETIEQWYLHPIEAATDDEERKTRVSDEQLFTTIRDYLRAKDVSHGEYTPRDVAAWRKAEGVLFTHLRLCARCTPVEINGEDSVRLCDVGMTLRAARDRYDPDHDDYDPPPVRSVTRRADGALVVEGVPDVNARIDALASGKPYETLPGSNIPKIEINPGGWEVVDAHQDRTYCGVFDGNGYSNQPIAIFADEDEAKFYLAAIEKDDDHASGDLTLLPVRRLDGIVWNSIEPVPDIADTPWPHDVAYADGELPGSILDHLTRTKVDETREILGDGVIAKLDRFAKNLIRDCTDREREILATRFGIPKEKLEEAMAETAKEDSR